MPGSLKGLAGEGELAQDALAFGVNLNGLIVCKLTHEDLLGDGILNVPLYDAAQRPGTQKRIEALFGQQVLGLVGQVQGHVTLEETIVELGDVQIDDLTNLGFSQLLEDDDVIQAVQELGPELLLELAGHLVLHPLIGGLGVAAHVEAGVGRLGDVAGSQVGGQDNDGVLEVHHTTLSISQMTVVQHLQKGVEDVRMSLLDLVEKDHGERLAPDLLGQLATLFVSHVPWRCAEETRSGVFLRELGHIHPDQGILIIKEELGQRLGQLGLAHAGGASEDEGTCGTLGILETHSGATNGAGQGGDSLILADNPLVQLLLHTQELLGLGLSQLEDRDACGRGDHLGDYILVDNHLDVGLALVPGLLLLLALGLQLLLAVAQLSGLLEVLVLDGLVLLSGDTIHLGVQLLELRRCSQPLDAQTSAGLIDQVNSLVRQVPVLNIARRELGRRLQSLVSDSDVVMMLIAAAQALEDLDGLGDSGLRNLDRLETPLQGCILFDVLAVLVGSGCSDGLQFATGQQRLEHVRGSQSPVSRTCADDGMDLIDEENDIAPGLDLLEHLLQALLEVAPVA